MDVTRARRAMVSNVGDSMRVVVATTSSGPFRAGPLLTEAGVDVVGRPPTPTRSAPCRMGTARRAIVDIRMATDTYREDSPQPSASGPNTPAPRSCGSAVSRAQYPSGCSPTNPRPRLPTQGAVSNIAVLVDALRRVTEGECVISTPPSSRGCCTAGAAPRTPRPTHPTRAGHSRPDAEGDPITASPHGSPSANAPSKPSRRSCPQARPRTLAGRQSRVLAVLTLLRT